jgi:hypothetical protein
MSLVRRQSFWDTQWDLREAAPSLRSRKLGTLAPLAEGVRCKVGKGSVHGRFDPSRALHFEPRVVDTVLRAFYGPAPLAQA